MSNNAEQYEHIEAFLQGKLSPELQSDFEAAMRRDAALAEAVELRRLEFEVAEALIANDIRAQMSRLRGDHPPDDGFIQPPKKVSAIRYLMLFAALLCSVAFIIWRWPKNRQPEPDMSSPGAPRLQADTLPTLQVPPSGQPLSNPAKQKPDNTDRLQALRLYQKPELGSLRSNETHADTLSNALNAWEKGDYAEAGRLATFVSPQDPNYWKAQYICAHAAFLRQQYTEANRFFIRISASKAMPWAEESDWYILLALLADGQRNSKDFGRQYEKIKNDPGHLFHESLNNIK